MGYNLSGNSDLHSLAGLFPYSFSLLFSLFISSLWLNFISSFDHIYNHWAQFSLREKKEAK